MSKTMNETLADGGTPIDCQVKDATLCAWLTQNQAAYELKVGLSVGEWLILRALVYMTPEDAIKRAESLDPEKPLVALVKNYPVGYRKHLSQAVISLMQTALEKANDPERVS